MSRVVKRNLLRVAGELVLVFAVAALLCLVMWLIAAALDADAGMIIDMRKSRRAGGAAPGPDYGEPYYYWSMTKPRSTNVYFDSGPNALHGTPDSADTTKYIPEWYRSGNGFSSTGHIGLKCYGASIPWIKNTDQSILNLTTNAAIGCWIKTTQNSGTYPGIMTKRHASLYGWSLFLYNYNLAVQFRNASQNATIESTTNISDGTWHLVAAQLNTMGGYHMLWDNGKLVASNNTAVSFCTNANAFNIGRDLGDSAAITTGRWDDVCIWTNTILDTSDILDWYNTGTVPSQNSLALWWAMTNEGSGLIPGEDREAESGSGRMIFPSGAQYGTNYWSFDGIDDYMRVGYDYSRPTNKYAVSMWVYSLREPAATINYFFGFGDGGGAASHSFGLNGNNLLAGYVTNYSLIVYDEKSDKSYGTIGGSLPPASYVSNWCHVVVSYNLTNTPTMRIAINGAWQELYSSNIVSGILLPQVIIGARSDYTLHAQILAGRVRVYTNDIADALLSTLYVEGAPSGP